MDTMANKDAFITLKDLKLNFANEPTCRLIDPTKSEIGRIIQRNNPRLKRQQNHESIHIQPMEKTQHPLSSGLKLSQTNNTTVLHAKHSILMHKQQRRQKTGDKHLTSEWAVMTLLKHAGN